jgi:hypothetical protein
VESSSPSIAVSGNRHNGFAKTCRARRRIPDPRDLNRGGTAGPKHERNSQSPSQKRSSSPNCVGGQVVHDSDRFPSTVVGSYVVPFHSCMGFPTIPESMHMQPNASALPPNRSPPVLPPHPHWVTLEYYPSHDNHHIRMHVVIYHRHYHPSLNKQNDTTTVVTTKQTIQYNNYSTA